MKSLMVEVIIIVNFDGIVFAFKKIFLSNYHNATI